MMNEKIEKVKQLKEKVETLGISNKLLGKKTGYHPDYVKSSWGRIPTQAFLTKVEDVITKIEAI